MLLAAKVITRRGDGPANMAIWKVLLPDFFAMGHVREIRFYHITVLALVAFTR